MYKTLELEQDVRFQRRDHALQKAGLVGMALLAAAGAAGALGGYGPLTRTWAQDARKTYTVRFDRFARHATDVELKYEFAAGAVADPIRIKLSKEYLEKLRFKRAVPEPLSAETGPDGVTFVFDVEDPQKTSSVVLILRAEGFGAAKSGEISQFIYP